MKKTDGKRAGLLGRFISIAGIIGVVGTGGIGGCQSNADYLDTKTENNFLRNAGRVVTVLSPASFAVRVIFNEISNDQAAIATAETASATGKDSPSDSSSSAPVALSPNQNNPTNADASGTSAVPEIEITSPTNLASESVSESDKQTNVENTQDIDAESQLAFDLDANPYLLEAADDEAEKISTENKIPAGATETSNFTQK